MKAVVLGSEGQDFAVSDLMASQYDLPHAAKYFRFALVPKVLHSEPQFQANH